VASALAIIRDEHRSLAAVLHGLSFLVEEIRAGRAAPDFRLIRAMLRYVQEFPDRLHHPKEDEHLFRALRARDPSTAAFLDELEAEHVAGRVRATTLADALLAYEREGAGAFERFVGAVDAYATFHWEHMRKEEDVVLPRASAVLTPEDWAAIDAAFGSNADPLAGVDPRRELRELFRRIAAMAPPPIGVGPGGSG
jgi:hemerythrin-like domain-containing protein